ncbi:hypothetical protein BDV38DRAFT_291075 [Aspergillus pseudotamarii]|uniref:Ankyrin repeat-containing domain protein n=1 Tax=Aspergillus pseudotamarii TaxID=132259 RepID=A0A5N6SYP8_ASPPS|nr:uncharacterized protein BDV38DRAFT_291075 [Aspergillus pseudotamarii]KAE8139795.1 hypothetical protein BDV38DRAFT_291075 [Aspergillus pseudotamarii]
MQQLAPDAYTVGWICAIKPELVAAREFLDEEHEIPDCISPNDNNNYTLGGAGRHNVVIAGLPSGEYGLCSAASVARDMLHSFPNIRIGLMVGIGGGAPSRKHDIRLGDIVVSIPRDGKSGVFQYDFGKTIQNQKFQPTGCLNQPPTVLRSAVSGLEAHYESKGHRLEQAINNVLKKNPRLKKRYQRPDLSTDRLYQNGVIHPLNSEADCEELCGDDPLHLISRPKRTEYEDNPAIHYGLIASANQLMKDASVRDRLAAEMDVLCFEMEAAGLMNHFPCLIIRGICDYSDSHKNKKWQGYAAMVAAAYARDLLDRIPPNKIEAERRIGDILSGVQGTVSQISTDVGEILHDKRDQEHQAILDWITQIDYGPQQSDNLRRRQQGTGQWLLDSTKYQTWLETAKQTLFCPGIPGAGKTILSSIVVNDLGTRFKDDSNVGIAYLYYNFHRQDEQKPEEMLSSLLKQLAQNQPSLPETVRSLHDRHIKTRTRPSCEEIASTLQSIAVMYSRVFIIIDALDECQPSDGYRTRFLTEIFALQAKSRVNLFATSRIIPEIIERFTGSESLEIRASHDDVRKYLDDRISFQCESRILKRVDLRERVSTAILIRFLLAKLHLDSLMDMKLPRDIKTALDTLPRGSKAYDCAYREAMDRVNRQGPISVKFAKKVLSWITCAKRPLSTMELQYALTVREIDEPELEDNLPQVADIVSVCAGLVTVDEESDIIRLVHYTTQEYFYRTKEQWFPTVESDIVTTCVRYLSFSSFESGYCETRKEFRQRLQLNPLYEYAAKNWGHHARITSMEEEEQRSILRFLGSEAKVSAAYQALVSGTLHYYGKETPTRITGVHLAVFFGLEKLITLVLKNTQSPDVRDSDGQTPLFYAVERSHEAVVKLLLEKSADPNLQDAKSRTPLFYAVDCGHEAVVKLLLEKSADPNLQDAESRTSLLYAVERGHEAVVKLLIENSADPNSKDEESRTPLIYAARKGYEVIVKLLLKEGANPNSNDDDNRTPLMYAAANGHEAAAKQLILARAGINSKDMLGATPLHWAAWGQHAAVTPLLRAIEKGNQTAIRLLLEHGANPVSKGSCGWTPLSLAKRNGDMAIIKLLQSYGRSSKINPQPGETGYHQNDIST